jgi:peptidoglycan/LPS O-acetylase OafA/YrhL
MWNRGRSTSALGGHRSPTAARSTEVDVIKTVAITMVMSFHFFGQLAGWHIQGVSGEWLFSYFARYDPDRVIRFIESHFYLGVNLFVIASGFGLYYSQLMQGKAFEWRSFLTRRLVALFPAAAYSLLFCFLFKGIFLDKFPTSHLVRNLYPFLGGFNLVSDQWFYPPINGEMWFLGLIFQLYLVFPLLIKTLEWAGERRFLLILFGISAGFRALYYVDIQYVVATMGYGFFAGRLFEFGFGMVLAKRRLAGKSVSIWWSAGILAFWGYFFWFSYPFADALMGVGLFALLWHVAGLLKFMRVIFGFLSRQSYMLFLIHHPILWYVNRRGLVGSFDWDGVVSFSAFFVIALVASVLSNFLLDGIVAGLVWIRRVRKPQPQPLPT